MDPNEIVESISGHLSVTHLILVHNESFTGALTPLYSILKSIRKVHPGISICIDNRNGYLMHSMPFVDSVIDYSVRQCGV